MSGDAVELDEEQAKERRKSEMHDLSVMLDTKSGRSVLRRILERAGIFKVSFVADSERLTSKHEGERNIGLWLLSELIAARPDAVADLLVSVQKTNRLDGAES